MSDELKPCEKCGGQAEFISDGDSNNYYHWVSVECCDCSEGTIIFTFAPYRDILHVAAKQAAGDEWNTRTNAEK